MNNGTKPWTEERVELLKSLWSRGLSAYRIACELGDVFSRNAVIGKAHRLGLARRVMSKSTEKIVEQRVARVKHQWRRIRRSATPGTYLKVEVADTPRWDTPEEDRMIPAAQRKGLLGLTAGDCRWPVGDPRESDFFYCGAPAASGQSYCAGHLRRSCGSGTQSERNALNLTLRKAA